MFANLPTTANAFYEALLVQSLSALKLNTFLDNFDARRFNHDGKDHSREFKARDHAFYFDWLFVHRKALFDAFLSLDDETSRRLFLHLVAYRLCGHLSLRLPVEFGDDEAYRKYLAIEGGTPSTLPYGGMFGGLKHFDFEYEGSRYRVDCLGMEFYLFRRQYFLERHGIRVRPEPGDVVVDGGACLGDSAAVFSHAVGPDGLVFAFDPVAEHIDVLAHNAAQAPLPNIRVMPWGLSDARVDAPPLRLNGYQPGFHAGSATVPLRTIDGLVAEGALPRLDFLKLDVEGFEMNVIRGAEASIERFRPRLAISIYHRHDDLFSILLQLKKRYPFYRWHLGHYTIHAEETVLYGIPAPMEVAA